MSVKRGFEDLIAWQKSRELVSKIYECSGKGQFEKDRGLRDQVRRASLSAMSNIAEGFEKGGDKEFIQFLSQAKASCGEVRSQLYVAHDLGYLDAEGFNLLHGMSKEVSRIISGLIKYLKKPGYKGNKFKSSVS